MYDVFEVKSAFPEGFTTGAALASNGRVVGVDSPVVGPGGGFATLWTDGNAQQFAVDANIESPSSVNAAGAVVGTWFDPSVLDFPDRSRAFVLTDVNAAPLLLQPQLPPEANFSVATDINDHGQVIGDYQAKPTPNANAWYHGFVYDIAAQSLLLLDTLPQDFQYPTAINNQNEICGVTRSEQGFRYNLQTSSARALSFKPSGLSDAGHCVGNSHLSTVVLDDGSSTTEVPSFGGDTFTAYSVNSQGVVVGSGTYTSGPHGSDDFFGFTSQGGETLALDDQLSPGSTEWHIIAAFDINDAGVILAFARRHSDLADRTVLLVPRADLPSSARFFAAFIALFGGVSRDGGGWGFIGGQFQRVPPWGPPDPWLSRAEREAMTGLMVARLARQVRASQARGELERAAARLVRDAGAELELPRAAATRSGARASTSVEAPSFFAKLAHRLPHRRR